MASTYRNGAERIATNKTLIAGDGGSTNYVEIAATTGITSLFGSARAKDTVPFSARQFYGNAATYNGVACAAAGSGILNDKWMVVGYDDGQAVGEPEAAITDTAIPLDYEDGTDIEVELWWTTPDTDDANVRWGVGVLAVGDGEAYNGTEAYTVGLSHNPATLYYCVVESYTVSGTGFAAGDCISLVVYRDADHVDDTSGGDALLVCAKIKYILNKLGAAV